MPALQLFLLGTLDIQYDGQQLPNPPTQKSQSLFAYLALHRQRLQPREHLAGMFWGDRSERKARRSLTTALWQIRRCLPDEDLLLSDVHAVQLDPKAGLWLDVAEFESLVARPELANLRSAIALYRGSFMDGFYDDWVLNERYRLETLFSEALARLMMALEARGDHDSALAAGKMAGVLALEGCDGLSGDQAMLRIFYWLGVRMVSFTWNRRNEFADGVGEGPNAGGLSKAGKLDSITRLKRCGFYAVTQHCS